jgi:hypothetical protein
MSVHFLSFFLFFFFFCEWEGIWSLNSGPHAIEAGVLPFKPLNLECSFKSGGCTVQPG